MDNINNIQVLDCTLRDGGYYNNWQFRKKLMKVLDASLSQAASTIVDPKIEYCFFHILI